MMIAVDEAAKKKLGSRTAFGDISTMNEKSQIYVILG